MQIVQYVHRSGEGLPAHAKVTEISQATAEAVRPQIHAAADALINDIKSGWLPASATAQEELAQAEAKVKSAEEALAAAQGDRVDRRHVDPARSGRVHRRCGREERPAARRLPRPRRTRRGRHQDLRAVA